VAAVVLLVHVSRTPPSLSAEPARLLGALIGEAAGVVTATELDAVLPPAFVAVTRYVYVVEAVTVASM
jgi:hypothetical protein